MVPVAFLGVTSPFFPGIPLSRKPPKNPGNGWFLKRTMAEKNGKSTPRALCFLCYSPFHLGFKGRRKENTELISFLLGGGPGPPLTQLQVATGPSCNRTRDPTFTRYHLHLPFWTHLHQERLAVCQSPKWWLGARFGACPHGTGVQPPHPGNPNHHRKIASCP